jgi:hypothetical protein
MKSVEIIYRYGEKGELVRQRPVDSNAARHRLDEGSRAFSALIESLAEDRGSWTDHWNAGSQRLDLLDDRSRERAKSS